MNEKIRRIINSIKRTNARNSDIVREISYSKLKDLIKNNEEIVIVDIRSPQEFEEKRIKNAINIPLYDLNKKASSLLPDKDMLIILYCACGVRSVKAYEILERKGYNNLYSLDGGLDNI